MVIKTVHVKRDYRIQENWPDLVKKGKRLEVILGKPFHGELCLDTVSLDSQGRFFIVSYNSQESETMMSGPSRTYMLQIGTPGNLVNARSNPETLRVRNLLFDEMKGVISLLHQKEERSPNPFVEVMAMGASPETAFPDVWNDKLMAFSYQVGDESGYFSIPKDKTKPPLAYPVGGTSYQLERVRKKYTPDKGVLKTLRGTEYYEQYLKNCCSF